MTMIIIMMMRLFMLVNVPIMLLQLMVMKGNTIVVFLLDSLVCAGKKNK